MSLEILSLGAGIQSSTLLLMSCQGLLPTLDYVIFADAGWELTQTYRQLDWLGNHAAAAAIPIVRLPTGDMRADALRRHAAGSFIGLPLQTRGPDRKRGIMRRSCSDEYKIRPIRRYIRRELLGLRKGQHAPKNAVRLWLGFSSDEDRRARPAPAECAHWLEHWFPFIDLDSPLPEMARQRCESWLDEQYPDHPIRPTACIGCPLRSSAEWQQVREHPSDWSDAVRFDRAIRQVGPLEAYLHLLRRPLEDVLP